MGKNGEINVDLDDEEVVWRDRQRKTIFALPISFTVYKLTQSRLYIERGLIRQTEDETRLYRIKDIAYSQSLIERLNGTGTVVLMSTDTTNPEIRLRHIKNAKNVKKVISNLVEKARIDNGVRTSELVGGGARGAFPDMNHDGIDDRLQ